MTEADGARGDGRTSVLAVALLFAVAVAIRIWAWQQTHVVFNDGPIFLALSDAITAGRYAEVLAHPFHPLYPATIALVGAISGLPAEMAAVAVSIAGGLATVAGIGFAVARAFDRELGWMAAWTVALHPWAVDFSSDVMSDGLYAGLFAIGFAALVVWVERPAPGPAMALGLTAGLAYLVRPEGLGLLVVAALVGAWRAASSPSIRGRVMACGALAAVAAALCIAPFAVALRDQTGDWTLSRKKSIEGLAAGRAGVRVEVSVEQVEGAASSPASGADVPVPLPRSSERVGALAYDVPPRTPAGALEAVSRAGRTALAAYRYEVAFFALLGLVALRGRMRTEREFVFVLPAVLYTGLLVLLVWGAGYVARRHALAAWLPLVAYAAAGFRLASDRLGDRLWRRTGRPGARVSRPSRSVAVLVAVLVVVWGARDLRPRRIDRAPVRAAAEWLEGHAGAGAPIAAQKLRVAYYARGLHVPLPSGRSGPIEAHLRGQGAAWVVIDEGRLDDHAGLAAGIGDWLQVAHVETGEGRRVLVLEIR